MGVQEKEGMKTMMKRLKQQGGEKESQKAWRGRGR